MDRHPFTTEGGIVAFKGTGQRTFLKLKKADRTAPARLVS
jgi:hypothetical protein